MPATTQARPAPAVPLGAALLDRTLALGWVRRLPDSRAVLVTEAGRRGFASTFGVKSETPDAAMSVSGDRGRDPDQAGSSRR